MKMIELTPEEFQKMILEIKQLKHEIKKLQIANDFLNNEIKEYNKKFAEEETTKSINKEKHKKEIK